MRIPDGYGKLNTPQVTSTKQGGGAGKVQGGGASSGGPSAVSGGDKITVSAEAQRLADAAASDSGDAKVEQLRAAMQNGTFKIDHQLIASRIVDGG